MHPLKRIFVLLAVVLIFSAASHAAKKINGYYTKSPGGPRINVTFLVPFPFLGSHPNYERMQSGIRYIDGPEKNRLLPQDAFEVSFLYNGTTVLFRSVYNNLSNNQMFLHVIVDGYVSLYHYYESHYSPGMYNPGTGISSGGGKQTAMRLVLQRDNGELFRIRRLFFKKDLIDFFSDCPTLLQRLHSSGISDLPVIVNAYNKDCG